jgi:phosphate uptake regulator
MCKFGRTSGAEMELKMKDEQSVRCLRLDLSKMLRISQRVVDYGTKAFIWNHPDFAFQTSRDLGMVDYLSERIQSTTLRLREEGKLETKQLSLIEAICAISRSLFSVCLYAYEISLQATTIAGTYEKQKSRDIVQMSEQVNCSMRLCVLAFINKETKYAETVLASADEWESNHRRGGINPRLTIPAMFTGTLSEHSIEAYLQKMMKNVRALAAELCSSDLLHAEKSGERQCSSYLLQVVNS